MAIKIKESLPQDRYEITGAHVKLDGDDALVAWDGQGKFVTVRSLKDHCRSAEWNVYTAWRIIQEGGKFKTK